MIKKLIRKHYHLWDWKNKKKYFNFKTSEKRLFYPGCSLVSADPDLVLKVYAYLKEKYPDLGIWADCCGLPLKKFVSEEASRSEKQEISALINREGIKEVITACGNCYIRFKDLAPQISSALKVTSLYDLLRLENWPGKDLREVIIHNPCSARINRDFRKSFVALAQKLDPQFADNRNEPLSCCLVKSAEAGRRKEKIRGKELLTYCGHCTMAFQGDFSSRHILQILFGSNQLLKPGSKFQEYSNFRRFIEKLKNLP